MSGRGLRFAAGLLAAAAAAGPAPAAEPVAYPSRPLRVIVPFAAGGGTDQVARAVAQKLTEAWGQSVIVDNRAGGNGNIGTDLVAKAVPDGHTLLVTTNATVVINPNLAKLAYDPVRDLAPVSQLSTLPFVLLVHPSVPVRTVPEYLALARSKPGGVTYGSSGLGGGAHLSGEMMKTMVRIDVTHVPYKGSAPALVALVGGEVQSMFVSILAAMPLIETNRLRPIGVTSRRRAPSLPNVPAVAEFPGLEQFETDLWYGMLAPARTDPRVVAKLNAEVRRIVALDDIRGRFEPSGTFMVSNAPDEFGRLIRTELARWAGVIKASGAKME